MIARILAGSMLVALIAGPALAQDGDDATRVDSAASAQAERLQADGACATQAADDGETVDSQACTAKTEVGEFSLSGTPVKAQSTDEDQDDDDEDDGDES